MRLQLADGGALLAATRSPTDGGHRVEVVGGGRPWVVTLQTEPARHRNALIGLLATLLAAGIVGLSSCSATGARRSRCARALARCRRSVSSASTSPRPRSLDRHGRCDRPRTPRRPSGRGGCSIALDDPDQPAGAAAPRQRRRGDRRCARTRCSTRGARGSEVLVRDSGELRRRYPDSAPAYARAGHAGARRGADAPRARRRVRRRRPGVAPPRALPPRTARRDHRASSSCASRTCCASRPRSAGGRRRHRCRRLGQRLSVVRTLDEVADRGGHPRAGGERRADRRHRLLQPGVHRRCA